MKLKLSLLIVGLLISIASFSQSPVDKCFPKEELFALGSYYYPEQWDSSQWERDLKKMSEMGINFTHFAEFAWAMMEPEEGKYNFEWLDKAVALAGKYGLKVILCTPTPTPPVWLSKKYPDILIQRDNGVTIQHGRRQHASWSSDRYCRYVEKMVTLLAKRYGNNPHIMGWQIDNEPGHYGVVDYSENAQTKFRIWLRKKYGTIDKLNDTWGNSFWSETYQNFDQIRLPNQQEVPDKPNPHAMLDLNRFMADELAGFVNMQTDVLHRYISKDQWVTTNLIPVFNPVDPARIDHPDFLTYTRYLVTGHKRGIGSQGFRLGISEDIGFPNDQYRNCVGKAYGVMELQPGQVNWGTYNSQPLPGAVRMWVYHVFAGGGKFVCNYRFRQPLKGSEQYHYGMIMTDGVTLSPGGEEYVRVAEELKKLRAAYDDKIQMPRQLASRRIGMLFDMSNYWEMEFQRQTDQWGTMPHIYKYYNLLKSFAAPVDVISEKEDFSTYPFLLAPAYQLLDNELVDCWTEYVKNGGHLILTCRTGQKDRNAKLWEAPLSAPIHSLTGVSSLFYDHLPSDLWGTVRLNDKNYGWNNWADVLRPSTGTEVWATYADQFYKGAAAVTHRKLGKGSVTYIGVDTDDGNLEKAVMQRIYADAGATTEDLPYGVIKEWRDGFHIALNYTSDVQQIAVPTDAEILIGNARLEPAGVVIWKERGGCAEAYAQKCEMSHRQRWSEEKIQHWYASQPWLVGCNYIPSTAINQIEMWSESTFDPKQIEKELTWAQKIGFNTLRVFLSSVVWVNDAQGLKNRINEFLAICSRHGIRPMFVFFDDCWNKESSYGKQPKPKPGVHNSGWVQDPSCTLRNDTLALYPVLQSYVQDIVRTYAADDRVLLWDLYNEPGNKEHHEESLPLLKKAFQWARECNPSQPLTAGVWSYGTPRMNVLNSFLLTHSDIITYHDYDTEAKHSGRIESLQMLNRPLICTEYMARRNNSRFQNILPLLKKEKVGAINWGFVAGKTNTIYAWDEVISSGEEPKLWFHDIYRPDGSPYDSQEIDCIRLLTGKSM